MNQTAQITQVQAIVSPIKKLFVYDIDVDNNSVKKIDLIAGGLTGLNNFLIDISRDTIYSTNSRMYGFHDNSEKKQTLNKFMNSVDKSTEESLSLELANHLLESESSTNNRVKQLHKGGGVKKGTMVICQFQTDDTNCIVISKLDFEGFIERDTYKKKLGLPEKNGVLKSCVININNNTLDNELYLLDSNSTVAVFWSKLFLDSSPLKDDTVNTSTAFREIAKTFTGLSRVAKVDYQQLKNNLITYFSTTANFTTSSLMDTLIGDYIPVSDKVDLLVIKQKIEKLVKDNKFDGNFKIDDKDIKSKYKQTIKLDGGIVITTNESYNEKIFSKEIDGSNYIIIKTEKGLDEVKPYVTDL